MPPKQKATLDNETKRTLLLGRASNRLSIGLVGLPNVGKSTLFNAISKKNVPMENRPFCTIDPTTARVPVPDEKYDWLLGFYKPKASHPAFLDVTDIAGLVRGAHKGEGLGNEFLGNIQKVDGIFHVVRAFDDDMTPHVEGTVDPCRDLEVIADELRFKDISLVEKTIEQLKTKHRVTMTNEVKLQLAIFEKLLAHLESGKDVYTGDWEAEDIMIINTLHLLSAKPVVYVVNMSRKDYRRQKNKYLKTIIEWVHQRTDGRGKIIPVCAEYEHELRIMEDPAAVQQIVEAEGMPQGIGKVIQAGFQALQLIKYYTCSENLVDTWTLRAGSLAPAAAGVIHSDFEKTFISGEVFNYEDLKKYGSLAEVRAHGCYKQIGKTYEVQDGDIALWKAGSAHSRK